MEKNKLQILILIVIAIIIVVAAVLLFVFGNKQLAEVELATTKPQSTQDMKTQENSAVVDEPISYANALVKYANKRIQLDPMCQAYPSKITYKDNTGIMIDNRSPKTRTVKVGTTFTVKPWGFKIVVLPDVLLEPKTIMVDCDQSRNVATILVQE
ncbi:MAG: hypothetical protein HY005_00160 [Candidatus Staskawiczbacteria bacterium]|nr:hypothetical protein [Candidatus Staskawiczbacteria bacterium]MBI3337023.1 hypothetical protein [Candidatus Staskawiczbacteria bacterium]